MIAIVVPTIRDMTPFEDAWGHLIFNRDIRLVVVKDGPNPTVEGKSLKEVMGGYSDLIFNKNDGVRNLGFAYVAKYLPYIEYIITLDDDVTPLGDPIEDHINALNMRVPTGWMSTGGEYFRGFPYGVREEAEVVLSHGIWCGIKDWDAPTQLVRGNPSAEFNVGPIPRGINYPMCGMNVAFKRKMLPHMYWAPMGPKVGVDRFADIWCGIESKKVIDEKGWAVVTGYSAVNHKRASDVFVNLEKEAKGIRLNENYGEDEYFKLYAKKRKRWEKFIANYI